MYNLKISLLIWYEKFFMTLYFCELFRGPDLTYISFRVQYVIVYKQWAYINTKYIIFFKAFLFETFYPDSW